MKILNNYAGIGGNRNNWDGKKHDIVAVENDPEIAEVYQERFPEDEVIVTDGHEFLRKNYQEFDFVWCSPPCQTHSRQHRAFAADDSPQNRNREPKYPDMRLYQEIIAIVKGLKPCRLRQVIQTDETFWNNSSIYGIK